VRVCVRWARPQAERGREPPNVVRDPSQNGFRIVAFNGVLSNAKNWREHGKDLEAEVKA